MGDWFASVKVPRDVGEEQQEKSSSSNSNNNVIDVDPLPFTSRRSAVLCKNGCVATGQPLASSIGLDLLRKGANAAEAAIAIAATLCVTEPCSTGLGGDMFCLYYDASTKKVAAINGSGKSPAGLNLDILKRDFPCPKDRHGVDMDEYRFSAHAVVSSRLCLADCLLCFVRPSIPTL